MAEIVMQTPHPMFDPPVFAVEVPGTALIVRWSPANPYWWGWHRYLYAMHESYGRTH